jgi:chemotaxis protein CheZ
VGIVKTSSMPDAGLHLNDVLQSTEEAAMTILEAATIIGSSVTEANGIPAPAMQKISEQVNRIYAACGFQDISGQRIKKVLRHLHELEGQLLRLSQIARGHGGPKSTDPLLNGPQLAAEAPTQQEVDRLFKKG